MDKRKLIKAIKKRNVRKVNKLLHRGVKINGFLYRKMTPLIYTIHRSTKNPDDCSHNKIIRRLLKAGAKVNVRHPQRNLTALMLALENKRSENVVYRLIRAGSDINAECSVGLTALIYAIQNCYSKKIINKLLKRGADVNCPSNGYTPLYSALHHNKSVEIVKLLIKKGADVHVRDIFGRSLLILPCQKNCKIDGLCEYKQLTDLLMKKRIDIKKPDNEKNTIIHNVTCNYIIYLALKNGVSLETKNRDDLTPLHQALLYNEQEKVKDLLLLNANPNCVDLIHDTPLHYEEIIPSEYFVSILLYHGADLLIKNKNGHTPLGKILANFNQYPFNECENGMKIMIRHYMLFINENDLDNDFNGFDDFTKSIFTSYINSCKNELNIMRSKFIKEELTFYDFCHLKKLYRDTYICISAYEYKYSYNQIRGFFPIYQDLIIMRIKDNCKKKFKRDMIKRLENISVKPFSTVGINSNVQLIFDCLYKIGKYLSYEQLNNLFLASLES